MVEREMVVSAIV